MKKDGQWHFAPAYDLNFTVDVHGSSLYHRHELTLCGKDRDITSSDILAFGEEMCVKNAASILNDVEYTVRHFSDFASVLESFDGSNLLPRKRQYFESQRQQ